MICKWPISWHTGHSNVASFSRSRANSSRVSLALAFALACVAVSSNGLIIGDAGNVVTLLFENLSPLALFILTPFASGSPYLFTGAVKHL